MKSTQNARVDEKLIDILWLLRLKQTRTRETNNLIISHHLALSKMCFSFFERIICDVYYAELLFVAFCGSPRQG